MKWSRFLAAGLTLGMILSIQPSFSRAAAGIGSFSQFREGVLYRDDFEGILSGDWVLEGGWALQKDGRQTVLGGAEHKWAKYKPSADWSDYTLNFDFKLDNEVHICFRCNSSEGGFRRYFLALYPDGYVLCKQIDGDFKDFIQGETGSLDDSWHKMSIGVDSNTMKIHLDDRLLISYTDRENPLYTGGIAFECQEDSRFFIDNITVSGIRTTQKNAWKKTGGPLGGLGYDVRISPTDKNVMFVTDNPSGVNKSINAGRTWFQANTGITTRTGSSSDDIPIFALTIDPNDSDIVWAGTQTARGVFKSVDSGKTWIKMDNGITEQNEITFRGFAVKPGDSDTVFAGVEIDKGLFGREFARQKGKIYKTTDGGKNWTCVWEGGSLVRIILFDPIHPGILYASTGIFDREAYNTTGEGVLKSTDGGNTWKKINNGLKNLFVGFLEMHPTDPGTLICAVGNHPHFQGGGIYRTTDGGQNWKRILTHEEQYGLSFTVATFSPSNPDVLYAGSNAAFYRSDNAGVTWKKYTKEEEGCFGPAGIRAGVPISAVVDPGDPMALFVNNYGGGVFKSTDGAKTWTESSAGYTGANIHKISVSPADRNTVYAVGRSGPFVSRNGGKKWTGLAYQPAASPEWDDITVCPADSRLVLASDETSGIIYRSEDGGKSWKIVLHNNKWGAGDVSKRHGFKAIEFAPSKGDTVYAGMRKDRNSIDGGAYKGSSFGMYKSLDGGKTWKEINKGLEKADKNINCIAVHPANENIVYIGTYQDGIFKSTDGGKTWRAASNGLMSEDVRSLAIDPRNPEIVYAGLGNGVGLYKSENGGKSWKATSNGIVVECPSYLQRIGQVNPGISLEKPVRTVGIDYVSTPWTLISSVVVVPSNPKILFVSDYQRGIYMSTSAGESWIAVNEGLDFKAVTSLALSKDETVLYASTSGGGVYRLELE